jgi:hypothetical protein
MRRFPLLIVLSATACIGKYPVRIRPGSNVALPVGTSLMGGIVSNLLCEESRRDNTNVNAGAYQCMMTGDTAAAPVQRPPVLQPAKRP